MALPQIIARNQLQRVPEINIRGTVTTIGTTQVVLYTVPVGKKAKIVAVALESNGSGANNFMRARIESQTMFEIDIADQDVAVRATIFEGQELDAGETINIIGNNAADNGAVEFTITVQETPV